MRLGQAWMLAVMTMALGAQAQTAVTTSGGTIGNIPQFTGTAVLGSSIITQTSGRIGIGTTSPGTPLQVVGTGSVLSLGEPSNSSGHQLLLGINNVGNGYGTVQSLYQGIAYTPLILNPNGGNIGIGTNAPSAPLTVVAPPLGATAGNTSVLMSLQDILGNNGYLNITELRASNGNDWTTSTTRIQQVVDITPQAYIDFNPKNGGYGMAFGSGTSELLRLSSNGNVGIGTTSPSAPLEVDGNLKLTSGSGGSITYQDGSVQSVAWNGVLGGGDYAESVNVSGNRAEYEPGDVLVIDPHADGRFLKSAKPYSTAVMGIYSTKPGVVGRRQMSDKSHMNEEVPMAMVGVVPTKVSTESGPIKPGDLLVTSSIPGYAMKGRDRSRLNGAIIGKALSHLDAGKGVIEVAISIQ